MGLVMLATGGVLGAQVHSSVRLWGEAVANTQSRLGSIIDVQVVGITTMVVTDDGSIFVNGDTGLGDTVWAAGRVVRASLGSDYALIIDAEGQLHFVGSNLAVMASSVPVLPPGTRYVDVAAGYMHALALRSDGVVVAWGSSNPSGVLNIPAQVAGGAARRVFARDNRNFVIMADGSLIGWGDPTFGLTSAPTAPSGVSYEEVEIGVNVNTASYAVALRSDGQLVAWGDNSWGQCNVPALPPGLAYVQVAAGPRHVAAVRSDGSVVCWGSNPLMECDVPPLAPGLRWRRVACGAHYTVGITSEGKVVAWGRNLLYCGHLPAREEFGSGVLGPGFMDTGVGTYNSGIINSKGEVSMFGLNANGECDVPPLPPGLRYERVYVGWWHTALLRSDGRVFAQGDNSRGMCSIPALPIGVTYTDVALAEWHTALLRSDGEVVFCGDDIGGLLVVPPLTPGMSYEEVDAARFMLLMRRSDGALVYVGPGGTFAGGIANVPIAPPGIEFVDIGLADNFAAALRSDGQVVYWGSVPSAGHMHVPPPLPPGVVYVEVDGGYRSMALRRSDGLVDVRSSGSYREHLVPQIDPGQSFLQVSAQGLMVGGRIGPTCTYVSFAPGCAGSMPAARLVPRDTPRIGKRHKVTVFDLPQNLAFMLFGWSRTLPQPLSVYGMPGCNAHVSPDIGTFLLGQSNQAAFEMSIPNDVRLIGLQFYNQAVVFDPGANALGAVMSAAAEGVIGIR
jgi:alpha-tubulin suppressor-like RCC1 family protein